MDKKASCSQSSSDELEKHPQYNETYDQWKGWNDLTFGDLSSLDAATFDAELKFLPREFPIHADVLEIGFGGGAFLSYAKSKCWRIVGIEKNHELIDIARAKGFDCSDKIDPISPSTTKYDLIVAFDVLEHIPALEVGKLLSTIREQLKPGGFFLARFPNGDSPFSLPLQNGDVTHVNYIGSEKIKLYANISNLEIIRIGGSAQPVWGVGVSRMLHRIISNLLKVPLELIVRLIFFPRARISFCSPNLTIVLKKKNL